METYNFCSHEKVSDHVYVVTENNSRTHRFTIGVVVGDEKILVIDSGLGMNGDLRHYIESFTGTDKPMICACTHGSSHHVGAACLFDEAYLNSRDYPLLGHAFDPETRFSDLAVYGLFNDEVMEYGRSHMVDNTDTMFKHVDEGDVFELGGVQVYPIRTPGRTEGHLAYHIPMEKIAFCGDAVNIDTHLKTLDNQGILEYRDMLYRLLSQVGDGITIYAGHLNRGHKTNVLKNLAIACEEVAMGKTAGDIPGETYFLKDTGNPSIRAHYHGNCCIVYDRSLLK